MTEQLARPCVFCSYDVCLGEESCAIIYTHLNVTYLEEIVQEGRRAYVVVEKQAHKEFKILGDFGTMSLNPVRKAGKRNLVCHLTTRFLESSCFAESGLPGFYALPYGITPVSLESVAETRQPGALLGHVQRRMISCFEIDAIRAVIGDFRTAKDVADKADLITRSLMRMWKRHIPTTESMIVSRTLSSEIVENALRCLMDSSIRNSM